MKETLPFLLALFFLAACGNSGTDKSGTDTAANPSSPAVENVNGNIPDSTNTVPLNGTMPTDTLKHDSVRGPDSVHRKH